MSWSSVKRLTSKMEALENESNRFVRFEDYYVVRVQLENTGTCGTCTCDSIKNFAEDMLCSSPQPIAVYHCSDEVALIFSCMSEGNSHQFNGDHHRIISKYATLFARAPVSNVKNINVKIIEFETQTQVITYMGWIVFQTSQRAMKRLSGGKITDNLLYFRTERELRDKLRDEANVVWNAVEPSERYGTFIRLRRKHNKIITSKLSEFFDAREYKRYVDFIFG